MVPIYKYIILMSIAVFFYPTIVKGQSIIKQIKFEGNNKTKLSLLNTFISAQESMPYDTSILVSDVKALKNSRLFEQVNSYAWKKDNEVFITYIVKEKITIMPIVDANISNDQFNFSIGAADYNFLGKGQEVSVLYKFYGRHSFNFNYDIPYINLKRWGAGISFSKNSTNEPLYFNNNTPIPYYYDLYNLELRGKYTFNQNHFLQVAFAFLNESYNLIDKANSTLDMPIPEQLKLNKELLKFYYKRDKINYEYQYLDGWRFSILNDYAYTPSVNSLFWKVETSLNYYKRLGRKSNWASRMVVGVAKFVDSPFQPFVLDNYINLRGVGDRSRRGNLICTANTEFRYSLFENSSWAIQGVGFIDIGTTHLDKINIDDIVKDGEIFSGVGLRLYSNRVFNFLFRVDYGLNLKNTSTNSLLFGIGQFF